MYKKSNSQLDKSSNGETEARPLKSVALLPPDYALKDPQILLDSYIEKEVLFAGIIPGISLTLDCTNRTDVLRVIDRGKREQQVPWVVQGRQHAAIFSVNVHHVKLSRRYGHEEVLLRAPICDIAAVCYIRDDAQHILALKYAQSGADTQREDTLREDNCQLAVMTCSSKEGSEEICALLGQCFQLVYTEAVIELCDTKALENATFSTSLSASSSNINSITPSDTSNSNVSTPQFHRARFADQPKMAFMSASQAGDSLSSLVSGRGTLPRKASTTSDSDLPPPAKDLLQQYMAKLHAVLMPAELRHFARLLQASYTSLPFPDFCHKVLDLYGPDRKYLLAGMRPFIPEKNYAYFEMFIERMGIADGDTSSGSYGPRHNRRNHSSTSSYSSTNSRRLEEYDMVTDISSDASNIETLETTADHFLPETM